jgi:hypothetical protein
MLVGQIEYGRSVTKELEAVRGGNKNPLLPHSANLWNIIVQSQPLDLSPARSVYILTSCFFEINFNNILLLLTPWSTVLLEKLTSKLWS